MKSGLVWSGLVAILSGAHDLESVIAKVRVFEDRAIISVRLVPRDERVCILVDGFVRKVERAMCV